MLAERMLWKILIIFSYSMPVLALAEVGTIEKVGAGSTVKVIRAGAVVRLKMGDDLNSGDEVSTDANTAVDIRLEDETLIRLGVNSSYKVQEDSKIHALVHRLLSGVVRVLVKPTDRDHTDPHIKFRMYTQEGTIGVRGTEFVVTRTKDNTQLKGLDGEVLFGAASADLASTANFQLVTRGFQSSISAGAKAAATPEKFDLKQYLDDLNGKSNAAFGVLASAANAKPARYVRAAVVAPVAAPVVAKAAPKAVSVPTPTPVAAPKAQAPAINRAALQDELVNAVANNDIKGIQAAMAKGALINEPSKTLNVTALQAALTGGKTEAEMATFLKLMDYDPDMSSVDAHTQLSPLMYAAKNQLNMEYVEALVSPGGADFTVTNNAGDTAESIAKASGYTEMVTYLQSKEASAAYEHAQSVIKGKKAK